MKNDYVLDSCALIAYLRNEEGAKVIEALFDNNNINVHFHKVSFLEVYYDTIKYAGIEVAKELFELTESWPIILNVGLGDNFIQRAGVFKSGFRISFADSFVLALASELDATLVTSDHHEFDIIDREKLIDFLWIR